MGEERDRGAPWEGLRGVELHEACLVAARGGDHRGLDVLIAELTPLVWHVARGHGLDRVTAADVVQAVWLALRRNLERVTQARALAGWLVVATRREARRVEARGVAELLDAELQVGAPGRDRRLWRAFRGLPRQCQELLRLTVLAERTDYRGLAEALSSPRGGPTRGGCLKALRDGLDAEENAELGIGGPEDAELEGTGLTDAGLEGAGLEGAGPGSTGLADIGLEGGGPETGGPGGGDSETGRPGGGGLETGGPGVTDPETGGPDITGLGVTGLEGGVPALGRASRIVLRPAGGALVGTAFEVDFTFVAEPPDLDRLPSPEPIRVLLHVDDALVHPLTRRARVAEDRSGAPVTFTVTPTRAGVLALVFRVHLERGGRLLQEVRAEVAVRDPGA
ncbi:sigma-70 family RNA polymerase sigma factor [Actinosynnema pretiosum subsp. pretiosum]|uniref:RNA polymerase, sigma-24 subunit, ECF subfamily n=2 Tax=Actinosynnema TaxID=40566 RepID=C6WI96_ACTMD|nr:RNA polymerase, sigma-24 subunit, ECF subfamily [Actinosynnema mirum DSM 43827]QUF06176.1 sigma-70 family RNA polymerase sigma factor [Actinosynnema pretiosum subsp. pretiosum]